MMDEWLRPEAAHVLQVTDLTRRIKASLENSFTRLWVQGEVSNLRRQSSGHLYFSLKDAGSQLPCVLFARDAARQSFPIEEGMELLLLGDISVYEPHGRYQLVAKIALQAGLGRLQERFQQLKQQLQREGLFDAARKQPLPLLPRSIAVVTSPTGAALRDFLRILDRRHFS
ncbi:MAG: exodeoxyribonuclease VII large subunit, partial [Coraliomargarita sp.]